MLTIKNKQIIGNDPRFQKCLISGRQGAQIHHAIFGALRPEKYWNYVPLHIDLHTNGDHAVHSGNRLKYQGDVFKTREICELFALLRAPESDLIKYDLGNKLEVLASDRLLMRYVRILALNSGFGDEIPEKYWI